MRSTAWSKTIACSAGVANNLKVLHAVSSNYPQNSTKGPKAEKPASADVPPLWTGWSAPEFRKTACEACHWLSLRGEQSEVHVLEVLHAAQFSKQSTEQHEGDYHDRVHLRMFLGLGHRLHCF